MNDRLNPTHTLFYAATLAIALTFSPTIQAGSSECATEEAEVSAGMASASAALSQYSYPGLGMFIFTLKMMNSGFAKIPKIPMCHFLNGMGMKPDKSTFPYDITKSFESMSVRLIAEVPTEAFAINLGYDAKATVTINGAMFMILYWGGTGADSKGFMIQAASGFSSSEKSPLYLQWDRTVENQFVKVFASRYSSSYLGSTNDGAIYGRATYNKTSGAVTSQVVMAMNNSGVKCYKAIGSGTKGSSVTIAFNSGGSPLSSGGAGWSTTDSTGMSTPVSIVDSVSTSSGTDTSLSISFDRSCAGIVGANEAGALLAGGDVSASAVPSTVFP